MKVYLVEKAPYIGGHMAQLDKTFPTLDCASCIFTPKTVEVARNKNIELLVCSEVEEVKGYVGNFTVTIKDILPMWILVGVRVAEIAQRPAS